MSATARVDIGELRRKQFNYAKRWLLFANGSRLLVVGVSIYLIFFDVYATTLAIAAALLAIADALCQWRSDALRQIAEKVSHMMDMNDGLGWPITDREKRDWLSRLHKVGGVRVQNLAQSPSYYASKMPPSVGRALDNLEESAWWTSNLARLMGWYVLIPSGVVFFASLAVLLISLQRSLQASTSVKIADLIVAVIVFMFSSGYIRMAFDYFELSKEAGQAESTACGLKERSGITEKEVVKAAYDYYFVRSRAPILPSWLWDLHKKRLNSIWDTVHADNRPSW